MAQRPVDKELEEIIELLKDRKLTRVAREIGVVPITLYNLVHKKGGFPSYTTIVKLRGYLSSRCLRGQD